MKLQFTTRGTRRKADYGLYYRSRCGHYALYLSDQVGGVPCKPHRWLALRILPSKHVISRHRQRKRAAAACQSDANRISKGARR